MPSSDQPSSRGRRPGDPDAFSGLRYGGLLPAAVLVAATAAVYSQLCHHEFLIWDDQQHVVDNPLLNPVTWHGVAYFWTAPYWGLYIPLSYTFFAAEALIAGQPLPDGSGWTFNPMVFHLGNLALHTSCALLVFVILRRLVRHEGAACAGALLFGLHPVQVESVAWISETRGVLCGLFSLVAVWQYLAHAGVPRGEIAGPSRKLAIVHYALATAAFVLALLSKPAAVAVPLIVIVLELGLWRSPLRRTLPALTLWLVVAGGWVMWTKSLQPDKQLPFVPPLWARPLLAGDALAFYLAKVGAPLRLGPDYGRTPGWVMQQGWFHVAWLLPAGVLALLGCFRNRRVWLTAAGVSLVWLLPVLGFVPFVFQRISTVADRYLYLALLGPALALAWLLARWWNRWTVPVTATLLVALGVLSFRQATHWRDDEALIRYGLGVNPRSAVAKQHLGRLRDREGRHGEAIQCYRDALKDHPQIMELHLSLAASLVDQGEPEKAVEAMRIALRRTPQEPLIYCKLGDVLSAMGHTEEAMTNYRKALQIDPVCGPAHLALGKLLYDRGDVRGAVEHNRAALGDLLNRVQAHVNLGLALQVLGQMDEARYHYRAALKLHPGWPSAHYNLGNLLMKQDRIEEAIGHLRAALRADPHHAKAHVNLGNALLQQGNGPAAIEHYRQALRIDPELVQAHVNLGLALQAEGRDREAVAAFRAALRRVPADSELAGQIRDLLGRHEDL